MSSSTEEPARYTLTELADLAGVSPRTVRYYLSQGLLPAAGASGPGAKYGQSHLARLRLIRRLQAEHEPLAEIRRHLSTLGDDAVLAIADEPAPAPPPDSALDYVRRVMAPAHHVNRASLLRDYTPAAFAAEQAAPTEAQRPRTTEPTLPRLQRSQWDRIELAPDVELHIRRPLARSTAKRVDRLVEVARDLLEENLP
jgi:DNA-binding transcriptional MerR regulator